MPTCPVRDCCFYSTSHHQPEVTIQPAVVVTPMRDQDVGLITARSHGTKGKWGPASALKSREPTGREVDRTCKNRKCGNRHAHWIVPPLVWCLFRSTSLLLLSCHFPHLPATTSTALAMVVLPCSAWLIPSYCCAAATISIATLPFWWRAHCGACQLTWRCRSVPCEVDTSVPRLRLPIIRRLPPTHRGLDPIFNSSHGKFLTDERLKLSIALPRTTYGAMR